MRDRKTFHKPPAMSCPHCGEPTSIRTSKELTTLVREINYRCENDQCGFIFAAHLVAIRTIVASAMPNPMIALPLSIKAHAPANDRAPAAANDSHGSRVTG